MATIGFGDYVALQTGDRLGKEPGYVVFTLFFILFGLAIFSASVNLLVLKFMTQNKDANPSDQEPKKRVVLENFSTGSDSIEDQTETDGSDRISSKWRPSLYANDIRAHSDAHAAASLLLNPVANHNSSRWLCGNACHHRQRRLPVWVRGDPDPSKPKKHHYYTVRRSPTRISHLLPKREIEDNPKETDSFVLHSFVPGSGRKQSL